MKKHLKTWTALGAVLSTTAAAHAMPAAKAYDITAPRSDMTFLIAAAGEGEGASKEVYDDADFVKDFGLIEGHLTAGVELYAAGAVDQAKTHMKHPEDEIYTDLVPKIEKRGVPGIADQISAIAKIVESGGSAEEARDKLEALKKAVDESAAPSSAKVRAEAVEKLVRTAADEYGLGVKDGKVTDPHEYQDAYGFVQAALRLVNDLPEETEAEYGTQFEEIRGYLDNLSDLWGDLTAKDDTAGDPSRLAGAAARIELAALSIKD